MKAFSCVYLQAKLPPLQHLVSDSSQNLLYELAAASSGFFSLKVFKSSCCLDSTSIEAPASFVHKLVPRPLTTGSKLVLIGPFYDGRAGFQT